MVLTYEQIKSVTFGAASVKEMDGKIRFFRFNDEELAYYKGTIFETKSNSTAGVQLDFVTDADSFAISGKALAGSSRAYFAIDVFVHGELVDTIKNFDPAEMVGAYTAKQFEGREFDSDIPLGKGEKRVTVFLPWSATPEVSKIELVGARFVKPAKKARKMLIYGDSITQGYDSTTPSRSYASQLAMALDADARNKAIGGEIFCPGLSAIKNDIDPEFITVAYGTNDWSKADYEKFNADSATFYKNLRENYPNAKIFAIAPIWRKDYEREDRYDFAKISKTIKQNVSDIPNVVFIEGFDLVPHDEQLYGDLRLHPNDAGFAYYAKNLISEIKKHI